MTSDKVKHEAKYEVSSFKGVAHAIMAHDSWVFDTVRNKLLLTYRRVVVRLGTSDDFSLRFFSKPSEPTELQNQEVPGRNL